MLPELLALPARIGVSIHPLDGPGGAHTLGPRVLQEQAVALLDQPIGAALSAEQSA